MTTGEKIKQLRKEKGYTQEKLAEMMNVSRQAVSRWEMDQNNPDMDKLMELSRLFEIPLENLTNTPAGLGGLENHCQRGNGANICGLWQQ